MNNFLVIALVPALLTAASPSGPLSDDQLLFQLVKAPAIKANTRVNASRKGTPQPHSPTAPQPNASFKGNASHSASFKGNTSHNASLVGNLSLNESLKGNVGHTASFKGNASHNASLKGNASHNASFVGNLNINESLKGNPSRNASFKGNASHNASLVGNLSLNASLKGNASHNASHNAFLSKAGRIDFVYTWVNETDPEWQTKHTRDSPKLDPEAAADSNVAYRFVTFDELRYSLRSVAQFMEPAYLGNIFIVTAGQTPTWLNSSGIWEGPSNMQTTVKIISHWDIIPSELLNANETTYNSNAIESWLHMIPGLSEQFVIMNDDCLLTAPVMRTDLFDDHNQPKIAFELRWGTVKKPPSPSADAYLWASYNDGILLDDAFEKDSERYRLAHRAVPITKSLYVQAHELFGSTIKATTSHKFRSTSDVQTFFLAAWVGIYRNQAVKLSKEEFPSEQLILLEPSSRATELTLDGLSKKEPKAKFACVMFHFDVFTELKQIAAHVESFFTSSFPTRCPWETAN